MTDQTPRLPEIRRPRLLIRAARFGQTDYNRGRDLGRLVRMAKAPAPGQALPALLEEEARVEEIRKTGDAGYSLTRHIELLIALIAEARLQPRPDAMDI